MTPREKDMLDAIRDMTVDGVAPTYAQLQHRLGLASKNGVWRMLESLEKQGRIRKRYGCRRSIEIVERPDLVALSTAELTALSEEIDAIIRRRACGVSA